MQNQNGLESDEPMTRAGKELHAQANPVPSPDVVGANGMYHENPDSVEAIEANEKGWLAYFKTRNFYIVLVLGYVFWNAPDILYALSWTREGTLCACVLTGYFFQFIQ